MNQGGGRNLGIEKVIQLCELACEGFAPDLTFFLDLDPEVGMDRLDGPKDRLENEEIEFHQKVRNAFKQIAEENTERIHTIDASQPKDAVFTQIQTIIKKAFKTRN